MWTYRDVCTGEIINIQTLIDHCQMWQADIEYLLILIHIVRYFFPNQVTDLIIIAEIYTLFEGQLLLKAANVQTMLIIWDIWRLLLNEKSLFVEKFVYLIKVMH